MNRIRRLPTTCWSIDAYHPDYYGYGQVDIFVNQDETIGERVICIFRKKDLDKYDDDNCFDYSLAILCNDCGIYSGIPTLHGLNAGQIIPIQFNGDNIPTVPIDWIESKFWLLY